MRKKFYDPDSEQVLQRRIAKAERDIMKFKLRREIRAIDTKLQALKDFRTIYPAQDTSTALAD